MMIFFVSLISIFTSAPVFAQYPLPANGSCDGFCQPHLNFTAADFEGIWFIVYNIPYFFMNSTKCSYFKHTVVNQTVTSFVFNEKFSDGTPKITDGTYTYRPDGTIQAVYLNIDLMFSFNVVKITKTQFALLDCRECGAYSKKGSGIYAFVFSKIPYPACDEIQESLDALEACGIPNSVLVQVDHSSCQTSC